MLLRRLPVGARWAAAAIAAAVIVAGSCAYAWAARDVTIVVDGKAWRQSTLRSNALSVLAAAGVELQPRDHVEPGRDARIMDGTVITVRRAITLTIAVDGNKIETSSALATIRDAVLEAGIELGPDDRTEPPAAEPPAPRAEIRVVRVAKEYEKRLWRIPRKVYRREDEHLELGLTRVLGKGQDGTEEVTFCTTYEDGVKISRALVDRQVLTEPVAETIAVGTSGQISRGGELIRFRRALAVTATGYYWGPECTGKYADGYTSIGLKAARGVVAVDPRVIPLRSRVYVDGYGYAIAGDVGSAIKGSRIDCCFDTYQEALNWGLRKTKVYILW
ncbi:MAG: hypothetical protein A2Y96_01915 [Firmicutes bacterium RBG_13_65_8]|nr:MAG: hypothetical protein A2Y96_01915 [Firmicutes bacterium RBG_13_65_8]